MHVSQGIIHPLPSQNPSHQALCRKLSTELVISPFPLYVQPEQGAAVPRRSNSGHCFTVTAKPSFGTMETYYKCRFCGISLVYSLWGISLHCTLRFQNPPCAATSHTHATCVVGSTHLGVFTLSVDPLWATLCLQLLQPPSPTGSEWACTDSTVFQKQA